MRWRAAVWLSAITLRAAVALAEDDPRFTFPLEPPAVMSPVDRELHALVERLAGTPALELQPAATAIYERVLATPDLAGARDQENAVPEAVLRAQILFRLGSDDEAQWQLAQAGDDPAGLWLAAWLAATRHAVARDFAADDSRRAEAVAAIDRGLKRVTGHASDQVSPWLNAFSALRMLVLEDGTFRGDQLPAPALRWEWDGVLLAAAARAGRHDIVAPLGSRLAVAFPGSARLAPFHARSLLALGRAAEARALLGAAARRAPLGWRARIHWGNACLATGDAAGALAVFDALVADEPARASSWGARAAVHRATRDWTRAAADLGRAVELEPANADFLFALGLARYRLEQGEPARECFARAAGIDPANAETWQYLGLCDRRLEKRAEALAHFARSLELDPRCADSWAYRGITRHESGDIAGAVRDYTRAFELGFQSAVFLAKRGEAFAALGETDQARADLGAFLEKYPDHGLAGPVRQLLQSLAK